MGNPRLAAGYSKIPNALLLDPSLRPSAKCLLTILYMFRGGRLNGRCYPSERLIAECLGVSTKQVQRLLYALKSRGWVKTRRRGNGQTNEYFLRGGFDATNPSHQIVARDATQSVHDGTLVTNTTRHTSRSKSNLEKAHKITTELRSSLPPEQRSANIRRLARLGASYGSYNGANSSQHRGLRSIGSVLENRSANCEHMSGEHDTVEE